MVGVKMEENSMDRLIGKHCKIITKEPGEERAHVVTGIVKNIDYDAGFLIIESVQGVGCLSIKTIEAIKPWSNKN
jgi:hypothetical protein